MKLPGWNRRFLVSTRGRIIGLLRSSGRTVNELAEALDLTDNAVRSHLTTLERDGLVRQSGVRPGLRRPHAVYDLTEEAEQIFPKAYGTILNQLLDVLDESVAAGKTEELLREVGRRLAAGYRETARDADRQRRMGIVMEMFRELGGLAEIEEQDDRLFIRGDSCPLAAVTAAHPTVCRMVEDLVAEIVQAPVTERCRHGESPRCCFEIGTP